jgi:2-amino-4,5-dihydroxy-6-oxo-7-(phosphooxy)heptanoate synthase
MNTPFAVQVRLQRVFQHGPARLFVVPLDHPITIGPVTRGRLDDLLADICGTGVDAVVLHKGSLRHVRAERFRTTALIVHLSASTALAPDPDAKCLVATVEEAVRLGADAVSVHVNIGCVDEARQLADLAAVAAATHQWGVPLLAMVYPRGPRIADPRDPELIAHAVTVAAELGADIVKTVAPATPAELADITRRCPIPVLVAGGAYDGDEGATLARVHDALSGGAAGVAMGRAVFWSPEPAAICRKIADLIHGRHENVNGEA